MKNKYGIYDLTPVEEYDGIYFKRDDLFKPFGRFRSCHKLYNQINGGKVRQCLTLLLSNRKQIISSFNRTVATATSVSSPQGTIVSRVAKELGFKSIIGIGGTTVEKALSNYRTIRIAKKLGSEIKVVSEHYGFNNVLYSRLKTLAKERPMFLVAFGMNVSSDRKSIIDVTAHQVKNIPEFIDTMVVIVGSGLTFSGIMSGVLRYKLKLKKIIAIQPFGHDRRPVIYSGIGLPRFCYKFKYYSGKYSYSKALHINVGFELDNIYESKAYDFMIREKLIDKKKDKVCFWVVGNANIIRG